MLLGMELMSSLFEAIAAKMASPAIWVPRPVSTAERALLPWRVMARAPPVPWLASSAAIVGRQ